MIDDRRVAYAIEKLILGIRGVFRRKNHCSRVSFKPGSHVPYAYVRDYAYWGNAALALIGSGRRRSADRLWWH
jgi:hypothetical protein